MLPARFEYHRPETLGDALALLDQYGEDAKVLAGGMSLIPLMKLRFASPPHLVDVNRIPELQGLAESGGGLSIKALTRHRELAESDLVRERYPTLGSAAPQVADPIVRNLGTIGGSLSHADPAGDFGSVLLALRAEMVVRSSSGERVVGIDDFLVDTFTTALEPNEVLTEIRIPAPAPRSGGTYLKLERKVGTSPRWAWRSRCRLTTGTSSEPGSGSPRWVRRTFGRPTPRRPWREPNRPTRPSPRPAGWRPRWPSRSPTSGAARPTRSTWSRCSFAGDWPPRYPWRGARRPEMQITVNVNGASRTADVEPRLLLVHFVRDTLGLTGTHVGCDTSGCGACTVLLDGMPVKSCTMFAVQADGRAVTTVEGMMRDGALHPIQAAFKEEHGLQCGFCTPGMMLVGAALLERNPEPSDDDVRWAISGNVCRCTGYMNIVKAIQAAGRTMAESGSAAEPAAVS